MDDRNLIDVGLSGYAYTCTRVGLSERLNRMLMNLEWHLLFQKPLCKSDHRLLLILQDRERSSPGSFPCFLADSRGLQSFSAKLLGSWLELGSGDSLFLR